MALRECGAKPACSYATLICDIPSSGDTVPSRETLMGDNNLVRLLEREPELGLRVAPDLIARCREELVARVVSYEAGLWSAPPQAGGERGLGYIVLEGVLAREMILAGSTCAELVGEGDFVQPIAGREERLVRYHVQWRVLTPLRLAVLDARFARALGSWPAVMTALLERSLRRAHRMAVHQALLQLSPVETRLVVLFWHLAERWGRVTPEGIKLELPLSHELLGHLVGVQRASVTTALGRVREAGTVTRGPDGTWVLHGSPPSELVPPQWHHRGAAPTVVVAT
jgi:CRP/FNR family transcriptional regulator, cyclic AMP receptor protein